MKIWLVNNEGHREIDNPCGNNIEPFIKIYDKNFPYSYFDSDGFVKTTVMRKTCSEYQLANIRYYTNYTANGAKFQSYIPIYIHEDYIANTAKLIEDPVTGRPIKWRLQKRKQK